MLRNPPNPQARKSDVHARPGRLVAAGALPSRRVAMILAVCCALFGPACQSPSGDSAPLMDESTENPDTTLLQLAVALEEGFEEDLVVVRVDGEEVLRRQGVTTDVRIGRAHAFDVRVERLPATVEVELPDRGISGRTTLEAETSTHLSVSVVDGAVRFERPDRFRYM